MEKSRIDTKEKKYPKQLRKKIRGSLLLVFLVSSLLLITVMALATLSSININLLRTQLEYDKAFLTAQASVAQFLYEMDSCEMHCSNVDISSPSERMDFRTRYSLFPVLPNDQKNIHGEVTISFDPAQPYFSTDNKACENPARGWKDRKGSSASVPPFSVDLMVNVRVGGSERHFEAVINRIWPYAAFCEIGPVSITSTHSANYSEGFHSQPSLIRGDILSFFRINVGEPGFQDQGNVVIGNICTTLPQSYPADDVDNDPLYIKPENLLKGKKKYNVFCGTFPGGYSLFKNISFPDKKTCKELRPQELPQLEIIGNSVDSGLSLEGTQVWNEASFTWVGSQEKINNYQRICSEYLLTALSNPSALPDELRSYIESYMKQVSDAYSVLSSSQLTEIAIQSYIKNTYYGASSFLKENLALQGTSKYNRFYLKGNLSNHLVKLRRKKSTNEESAAEPAIAKPSGNSWETDEDKYSKAGLILKDCMLFIDGDVELVEFNPFAKQIQNDNQIGTYKTLSIEGSNATLIVSGNLKIIGGRLDSKDKGMVMLARNLEFSTMGIYKGLILSKGAIFINPHPFIKSNNDNRLHINGAIACSGTLADENCDDGATVDAARGVALRSVDLTMDPRYTKALHQFGKAKLIVWQEIK